FPASSTATQSVVEGQETPSSEVVPSTFVTVQVAAAPRVGFVEAITLPEPSTAAQSNVDGQATAESELVPSASFTAQFGAPPSGFVEVSALPAASTLAQNELETHATASGPLVPSKAAGALQFRGPAVVAPAAETPNGTPTRTIAPNASQYRNPRNVGGRLLRY